MDNGKITCWASEINDECYGKYVWITELLDHDEEIIVRNDVEVISDNETITLVECKSLASAKRRAAMRFE